MTNGQYGAYGSNYQPQGKYRADQYAYPKKKFPIQQIIIIVLIAAIGFLGLGYVLGWFSNIGSGVTQAGLTVSPQTITIQSTAGRDSTASFSIFNPTEESLSTSMDTGGLPPWIQIDKNFVTVAPGSSEEVTITVSPNANTESTNVFLYFSDIDSFVSISVEVLPPPSVSLSLSKKSLRMYQGDSGNILLTLSNKGQSPAVNTTLSFNGISEEWITYEKEPFELDEGEDKSIPINFNIPDNSDHGNYEAIITTEGIGFSESESFSLTVLESVGVLSVSPEDISGTRTDGEVVKITISNNGNAELRDINVTATGDLRNIISFSSNNIQKLGAGQSTEIGATLSDTNETYTGSIEIRALDTHETIQSKIITATVVME